MTGLGEQLCVLTTKETPRQVPYGSTVVVLTRSRGEPLQLPEEDGPDHDGAGGATVCAHHQGDPRQVLYWSTVILRSESARGLKYKKVAKPC